MSRSVSPSPPNEMMETRPTPRSPRRGPMPSPTTEVCNFMQMYPEGVQLSNINVNFLTRKSQMREAITFDEVTLADQPVDFHPNDVNLRTHITRNIYLKGCGIMTAAMDTVTEGEMALAMAKVGGIGIIHRNLSAVEQAAQVKWVRRKINFGGMITKPICFKPDVRIADFEHDTQAAGYTFTSFPVVADNKMLGMITRECLSFVEQGNPTLKDVMIPVERLVTAPSGTNIDEAYHIMQTKQVKKLPILNNFGGLDGMYVWNDVKDDKQKEKTYSLDNDGHFLVGAAIGVGPADLKRASLLIKSGCKLLVIDSSHGSCKPVKDQIVAIRARHGNNVEIIAGNVASYSSAMYLLQGQAVPDGIKVGIGPGSICTTRQVTGHGIPQITAIFETWRAVRDHGLKTGYYVPVIADGGMRTSGDIVKALSAGASGVMLGSMFAGAKESPGLQVEKNGRIYKTIRGMGSRSAMEERSGSRMRYHRQDGKVHNERRITKTQAVKMVPEGVEGLVEYRGTADRIMGQLLGGIQAGLAHSGAKTVAAFQAKAEMWMQSTVGVREGRPHDIADVRD